MAASVKFVEREQADPKEIDSTVRNKWNWGWCDKIFLKDTPDEHLVGDCFRKLHNPGEACLGETLTMVAWLTMVNHG